MGLKSRKKTTQNHQCQKFLGKRSEVFLQCWEETGTFTHDILENPCEGSDVLGFLFGSNNSALPSSTSVLSRLRVEPSPYNATKFFSNICLRTFLFPEWFLSK